MNGKHVIVTAGLFAALIPAAQGQYAGIFDKTAMVQMTAEDRQIGTAHIREALEKGTDGQNYSWINDNTGAGGMMELVSSYRDPGTELPCRYARIHLIAGGKEGTSNYFFCKRDDAWMLTTPPQQKKN